LLKPASAYQACNLGHVIDSQSILRVYHDALQITLIFKNKQAGVSTGLLVS
jgi:hypothetical protein